MIRPGVVLGVARAEARLMRRLVRYWVFVVLATLLAAASLSNFYFIHRMFSWGSASAAMANPRFFVANFGSNFLFVFLIGLVFLGFDLRSRDRKDRIIEVVDSLPCTNLELILGKFSGIIFACWVPAVIVTGLLMLAAVLIKPSIEPWSTIAYLIFMTIPAFVFTLGLIFFLTLLLRHRLLAAVASLVVIVLAFFVSLWWIPFYVTPLTDVTGGYVMSFPSDIIPRVIDARGLMQRTGYLLAGIAFLFFAAAIHPRKDDASRPMLAGSGAVLLLLGGALCGAMVFAWKADVNNRVAWREAHAARSEEPAPDLIAITGDVKLQPPRSVAVEATYRFRAPRQDALDTAIFTLNPGMRVEQARSESGQELSFSHENGLLEIQLPGTLAPGQESSIQLSILGRPDPSFAYITASLDPVTLKPTDAQILILGFDPFLLDRRFVALLPGVRWLPASGTEVGRGDPNVRPFDFFTVDLTVDVPEGWLVAGPGRRQEPREPAEAKRARFRFSPGAPLPDVALVAGRFVGRSTEIDGVLLEVLLHPAHEANLDFFEDAAGEIRDWLAERLEEAANVGLDYPYDALTMVEIPNTLRGFAGGWRMDSTLIQPAMILTRESGLPTAWFKGGTSRFEAARDREGGIARAKREGLERFFENDLNGGNPFIAAARSFFGFQTSGEGPEGLPLDYVWESLSSEILTGRQGYFSVHFFDQDFGQEFILAGQASQDPNRVGDSYADVLIHRIRSTNSTWDMVNTVSLTELDPTEDPERAINMLSLKGGAMASSMLDGFGMEKTGHFLAALRRENLGESYDRADVIAAGEEVDEDLEEWLGLWIDTTELPGFTLGDVRYDRLSDDEDGSMRYQLSVTLRNEEAPAGMARLEYRTEEQGRRLDREKSEPFQVPGQGAVEIGLVTSSPLASLRVAPYLALNRDPFNVPLPPLDEEKIVEAESFVGMRTTDWAPPEQTAIVVDDLDGGFSVEEEGKRSFMRMGGRGAKEKDLDQGLPTTSQFRIKTSEWSRMTYPDAYGKYRHTMAVVRAGEGKRTATFTVEIPDSGQWQLEYYFAPPRSRRGGRGSSGKTATLNLTIEDSSGSQPVTFDAAGGESGWNSLGTFEIAGGEVKVMISDETDGDFVVADAIRWVPVARGAETDTDDEASG